MWNEIEQESRPSDEVKRLREALEKIKEKAEAYRDSKKMVMPLNYIKPIITLVEQALSTIPSPELPVSDDRMCSADKSYLSCEYQFNRTIMT